MPATHPEPAWHEQAIAAVRRSLVRPGGDGSDGGLARAPADHLAIHDGHESVDSVWINPAAALSGAQTGQYTVIFPTRLNIEMLGTSSSVDEAMTMARSRTIVPVLPWTEKRDTGVFLCIPAEAGYSITEEKMG